MVLRSRFLGWHLVCDKIEMGSKEQVNKTTMFDIWECELDIILEYGMEDLSSLKLITS